MTWAAKRDQRHGQPRTPIVIVEADPCVRLPLGRTYSNRRGEQVRVTVRGRAVADLVPATAAAGVDRVRALVAQGRVTPPATARPNRAPRLAKGGQSASALVLADRDAEH